MKTENFIGYKLSPQQSLVWQTSSRAARVGCVQCTVQIDGPIHPARLREAIRSTVDTHEILRTSIEQTPGMTGPVQVISAVPEFEWRERNAPGGNPDAENGSTLVAELVRETAHRSILKLHAAAVCADRASLELLMRDISHRYAGSVSENAPVQYADLSAWLNETVAQAGEGKEFWNALCKGHDEDIRLPGERTLEPDALIQRAVASRRLDAAVVQAISKRFSIRGGAALFAAWQILLTRLTGAPRMLIAVMMHGRSYEGMESAIGLLERQVPVPSALADDLTVEQTLFDAQAQLDRSADLQEYFDWEDAERLGHRTARFGFGHRELAAVWTAAGLRWEVISVSGVTTPNVIDLWCTSTPAGIECELAYDESRFDSAAAVALLRQYETLLGELAHALPSTRITDLSLVSSEERVMLASFNETSYPDDYDRTVVSLFEEQAARTPHNIALSFLNENITYAELNARADRIAAHLLERGAAPDGVIGICMDRGISMVTAMLGIWKAGGAYLPLSAVPEARARYMLSNSGARIVISGRQYDGLFDRRDCSVILPDELPRLSEERADPRACRARGSNLAYVIYTSGSTGQPKGVQVEHRSLMNHMLWAIREFGLGERERMLMKTSITFDASVWEWLFAILQGGTLVIAEEGMQRDSQYLVSEMRDRRVTTLQVVPTMLRVLIEEPSIFECSHLERVFVGGEALDSALISRFHERTGKPLINLYGPTEATIDATSLVVEPRHGTAIGRPIANTTAYIVRHNLDLAAIGEAGELCIGGAALARAYAGRPQDTAEKYVPNPFATAPGQRMYRTGDRARYLADGILEFLGRTDGQVKIRGHRIELTEIERVLQANHGVVHAAVLVKERATGERQLVAYLELTPASSAALLDDIRNAVARVLPDYMCPAQYVRLEHFPRTASGKLDRRNLPEPKAVETAESYTAPRNDVERTLADIWAAVLGVARVGVNDNFFEAGGDSILGIQIVAKARQAGLRLMPRHLFQYQTIAELAQIASPPAASPKDETAADSSEFPLTPIQQRFFEQPTDNIHHFNQAFLFEIRPEIRADWLEAAFARTIEHHEALRLRFTRGPNGWRQRFGTVEGSRILLTQVDLSGSADPNAAVLEAMEREQQGLNIEQGPLIRLALFDFGAQFGRRLLIVAHHLAIDGVSWRILLEDAADCYRQFERGEAVRMPGRTTSYRTWAEGLAQLAPQLENERRYWLEQQKRAVDLLHVDDPAGANTVSLECRHDRVLDPSGTRDLLTNANKAYNTQVVDLLLSALAEALYRWKGQTAVRVDMEGHGREEIIPNVDLTRTVGWFTTIFPVTLEWREGESVGDRIRRIKQQLRSAPNHGIGYGLLRHSMPENGIAPQTQLLVNYLGQFDATMGRDAWLPVAREGISHTTSPGRQRANDLELNAIVIDGRLQMSWSYSSARYREQTVAALARHFDESLREIMAHCDSPEAGGFISSDFSDFKWRSAQIEKVAAAIMKAN